MRYIKQNKDSMKKGVVANNKEVLSNKGYKDIVEGIGFILMVVSIITLLCVMYEVNKVSKDIKVLKSMTIRK